MGLLSQQYGKVIELTAGSCLTAPIICGSTCVQSAQILSTKVSVGSLNASYDLYNNGTTYLNGAVTIDDTVTAHRFKSSCRLWNTSSLASNNFFADSGASGGDGFALGQGTGILDIWVTDDSVSELRSVFRAQNQGNCIVIGRGCSANDNANIPVYMCKSLSVSRVSDSQGIAIGCNYTNTGNWDSQLDVYGNGHSIFRINHGCGTDGANNSRNNCIYAHCGNPFVICSSGNIRIKPGTGTTISCGVFCSACICGTTCVYSNCVYTNKLQADTCVYANMVCLAADSYTDMANGIVLGKVGGLPQAAWGESGGKTGRIEIGLPTRNGEGGLVHHGMVHVAIDVYEYNSNDATTIIVGGHNWNCRWYNCGAHITGGCTDKTIKLAYHSCGGTNNGRYVILLGECDSTWCYGSVHVRSITNGLYYCDNMNMGTPWYVKRVTCADSYYNCASADLRSSSYSMAGYQCAITCVHTPRVCATTCVDTSRVQTACLHSTGNICGSEICAGQWFRNVSGKGIYNSATGIHWYSSAANNMILYSGQCNNVGIIGQACGANRGCINWNCHNQIHIYDSGGNVRFLVNGTSDIRLCNTVCFYGNLHTTGTNGLVSGTYGNCFYSDNCAFWNLKAGASSGNVGIRFRDSGGTIDGYVYADNGHIGFLDQASHWAYGHKNDACHWWRINNTTIMDLYPSCLCHNCVICSACCVRSKAVYGSTWVCSGGNMYANTCLCTPVVCAVDCVFSCRFQHGWRDIAPGGDYDKFYPISFTMKGGYNSEDILEISQDNVHQPGSSCGAMYLKLGLNITGWGHISNHYVVHKYANSGTHTLVSKVRAIDHSTCRVGVWLRGGLTYHYRSREGTIACNITGGTTACCLSYDNSNNAYDVYVQYTSNVEDCNFGNQGGCNAGNAYLNHHNSLGTSVVLTTGNLQKALCCGCYTNTVCLGNCGVLKNTNFTTGVVCGNDCVRGSIVCSTTKFTGNCLYIDGGTQNAGSDATVYVTATNNNDWGLLVNKNNGSSTDYGVDVRVGASAGHAYYARFNNTIKYIVRHDCLCHNVMICSPAIKASSYMNSGKFCAGSAYLCNGCLYVNGRTEGCCHIAGSSYFCNNCLHVAGGNICSGNAIYLSEWLRFNCNTKGLYWAGSCQYHVYPAGGHNHMYFRSCADSTGIILTTNNNTTARGFFYANCNNNVGILDKDGNWAIRHDADSAT